MEVDKHKNSYQEKEMEVIESKRLQQIEQNKLKLKEDELRESTAQLSVYQQLDSSKRFTTLYDDVEPQLLKNKNMQKKCEDLERQLAILKQ